ncbi:MAG: HTH domain-containing protein [Nitrososphaeria archaeon]|nr:HTH domain-containing protein [Nitrososphaeria archaeon]
MSLLPNDLLDLLLLEKICSGEGIEINIASLSRLLKKHRKTIKERVDMLLSNRIIDRPVAPFKALFKELPLLVVSYADLPYDSRIIEWLKEDKNIFAAYRIREGESNMLIFEFHKSIWDYHVWRENIVADGKIPERGKRAPSNNFYFSNQGIFKYEPSVGFNLIKEEYEKKGYVEINGCRLDNISLRILECLLKGEGIVVNENELARKLNVSRRTVLKKIQRLKETGIILKPLCRFPNFFVPPNYLLFLSLVEVRSNKDRIVEDILKDDHISLAYHISNGRYNLLLFQNHKDIEDYLTWEDMYTEKYPESLGSIKITLLSPKMTILIDQQKVSLGIIRSKIEEIKTKMT